MNNLESIVPPLELCKRIPVGKFEDSALVWKEGYLSPVIMEREVVGDTKWIIAPAPTLAEIMEELDAMFDECDVCVWNTTAPGQWGAQVMDIGRTVNFYEYDSNPATAALRLWLEAKGVKK